MRRLIHRHGAPLATFRKSSSGAYVLESKREGASNADVYTDGVDATVLSLSGQGWPFDADIDLRSVDLTDSRYIPSREQASSGGNILFYNSANIPSQAGFAGTITPRDEDGYSTGKAQRIQFSATSQIFYFVLNKPLETGSWKFSLRCKSKAGAGSQNIRFGLSTSLTSDTVTEAGWSLLEATITGDGTNKTITLQGDGTNTPDLLIDEAWLALDTDAPTPFPFAPGQAGRSVSLQGEWELSGNVITNMTSGGFIHGPDWPLATTPTTGFTVLTAFRVPSTPSGTEYLYSGVTDANVGSLANDTYAQVKNDGTMQFAPRSVFANGPKVDDNKVHIVAQCSGTAERSVWIDGAPQIVTAGSFSMPTFDRLAFLSSNGITSLLFNGDFVEQLVYKGIPTTTELADMHSRMATMLTSYGLSYGEGSPLLIFEGDSRMASNSVPTFAWKLLNDKTKTGNVQQMGGVMATSGHGIADLTNTTAAQGLKDVSAGIANALALGRIPVVVVLIGYNDNAAMIADPVAYFALVEAYYQTLYNAGARVVACTELPVGSADIGGTGSDWETARGIVNPLIKASAYVHAVADIGDTSTVMGDPDSPDLYPANWTDDVHPNSTGHDLLAPVVWSAIEAAVA